MAASVAMATVYGRNSGTASDSAPAMPVGAGNTAPLPTITVTGKVLKQRIDAYVSRISGANVASDDHPMARWRTPICPLVAGLPRAEGQGLFDHLSGVLTSLNISLGAPGCRPNFFVIATTDPMLTLKSLWRRAPNMNGGHTGFTRFIDSSRPVRIWYNTELTNEDGAQANFFGIGTPTALGSVPAIPTHQTAPRHNFWAIPDLTSVIAVVDLRRMHGMSWGQVADYIAMAGVAEVDLDPRGGEAPTIMSLFTASAEAKPQGLSDWDRSFIKELYATDSLDKHQRVWIAKAMFTDVAPDSAKQH